MTGWIAISLGDVTGIGPEVTLKALAVEANADETKYLIIGDPGVLARTKEKLGIHLPLTPYSEAPKGKFFYHDPLPDALPQGLAPGSPAAARAAVAWLTDAGQRCLKQEMDAMVTAPV